MQLQIYPDYYGRKAVGAIRGISNAFHLPSQLGGPLLAAWVYDFTGSYLGAFTFFVGADILGALLMFYAKPPEISPGQGSRS